MTEIKALQPEQLRSRCNPDSFRFRTTDDLPDLGVMVGQERALTALRFGVGMPNPGYNLYALGPAGFGKRTAVSRFLKEKTAGAATPADWVYVNNFNDSSKPLAIRLPTGRGRVLQRDMQQLVEELRTAIPAAFESDDYGTAAHRLRAGNTAGTSTGYPAKAYPAVEPGAPGIHQESQ